MSAFDGRNIEAISAPGGSDHRDGEGRKCILVLGMHRSGTSALTRVLSLLGAALPKHILGGDAFNEKGHWESARLVLLHQEMEAAVGRRWDDWGVFDPAALGAQRLAHYKAEIARLIVEEYGDASLFVVKDPRICRFVPLYEEVLGSLSVTPLYALVLRNPLAVFKSLEARNGITTSFASLLWLRHVLDAEAATRGKPRAILSYERLLADWRGAVDDVGASLELTWPRPPQDAAADTEEFLSYELHHYSSSADDVAASTAISTWVKDAYQALLILKRDRDPTDSYATLDRVRAEFETEVSVFGNASPDSESARRMEQVQTLEKIVESQLAEQHVLRNENVQRVEQVQTLEKIVEGQAAEQRVIRNEIAQRVEQVRELEKIIEDQVAEQHVLRNEIVQRVEQMRKLEQIVEDREAELAALRKQLIEHAPLMASLRRLSIRVVREFRYLPRKYGRRIRKWPYDVRERAMIARSGLFDAAWYISQNPDVAAAGTNPLAHYLNYGALEGRDPNPLFDSKWYISQNPDVAAAGTNPLVHYLRHGALEGRDPNPSFDGKWYLTQNPDVASTGMNPLEHYLRFGESEGRITRPPTLTFFTLCKRHFLGHVTAANDETAPPSSSADARSIPLHSLLPSRPRAMDLSGNRRADVIIPVYDGFEESRRCIESVLDARPENSSFGRLILVDDCGPSAQLRAYLDSIGRRDGVLLLRNPVNMGFVASVNRAMAAVNTDDDIVLLNSDTEVCSNWLDRLAAQASADARIGTVTPFSNNATVCSFPDLPGQRDLPPGLGLMEIDAACKEANALRAVDLPTGVGSCMFIKHACLDDIGAFDEKTFGTGYGEETDFCLRAIKRNWRHVLAGDVFVYHAGETSFKEASVARKARAFAIICERYPTYAASVDQWIKMDPALPLRLAVTAALWRSSGRPVVLHVLHSWGGGSEKHVAELASKISSAAHNIVLVTRTSTAPTHLLLMLQEQSDWRGVELSVDTMAAVAPFLASFGVSQVHVHQCLEVFDQMPAFLRRMNVPYDLSIHDYGWICPRINLLAGGSRYCGEPDETGCLRCLADGVNRLSGDIFWWRHRGTKLIAEADRVLCPSVDVAQRIRRYVPGGHFIVVPHDDDLYRPERIARIPSLEPKEPLRVAVLGILSEHKGGAFLLDCIDAAQKDGAPIEWHVIGEFGSPLQARVRKFGDLLQVTGRYKSNDVPLLIEDVAPHVVFMPQRWPETYSYTLSEAFKAGCAILAPDIGAFSERTAGVSWCWLYPVETSPHHLVEKLMTIRRNHIALNRPPGITSGDGRQFASVELQHAFYSNSYLRKQPPL